jgi:hypothetical protein
MGWREDLAAENADTKVTPEAQLARDKDALRIKKLERSNAANSPADNMALDREIARDTANLPADVPDWRKELAAETNDQGRGLVNEQPGERAAALAGTPPPPSGQTAANPRVYNPPQAAALGFGNGVLAGLGTYPVAAIAMGADKLQNPTAINPLSWKDALKYTRQAQSDAQEQNPISYTGAQMLGGGVGFGKAAGAVGTNSVKGLALIGAGQGAIGGYTANDGDALDYGDAAIGAGVGGTLGALGGYVGSNARSTAAKEALEYYAAQKGMKIDPSVLKDPSKAFHINDDAVADIAAGIHSNEKSAIAKIIDYLRPVPVQAVSGALAGGAYAGMTGGDPVQGAKYGAASVVGLAKAKSIGELAPALQRLLQRNPNLAPMITGRVTGAANTALTPEVLGVDTRSRLQKLADEYRNQ